MTRAFCLIIDFDKSVEEAKKDMEEMIKFLFQRGIKSELGSYVKLSDDDLKSFLDDKSWFLEGK